MHYGELLLLFVSPFMIRNFGNINLRKARKISLPGFELRTFLTGRLLCCLYLCWKGARRIIRRRMRVFDQP